MERILRKALPTIQPPKKIKPSDWVEENLIFPDGPMQSQKVRLFEFQKEPLNKITDPNIRRVVLMSSAQLLKSTTLMNSAFYLMKNVPGNMLFATQTETMTRKFRTGKWDRVLNSSDALRELAVDKSNKKKTNNATQQENVDGTQIYFSSLNSPSQLRSVSCKYVFLDEVSSVDPDSPEGNPLVLAEQRVKMIPDHLIIISSTPIEPGDLITQQYELSDQRKYFIPCPHCEEYQELLWENVKFEWKQIDGGRRAKADPDSAVLECSACREPITDSQRVRAIKKGYWKATNPEVTDVAGYQISRLYSPLVTIKSILQEFSNAHLNFDQRTFWNNSLGLPYTDEFNKEIELPVLENLRDDSFDIHHIPDEIVAIFQGIDQQQSRLEITTIGITDNEKKIFVLDHRSFETLDTLKVESPVYDELYRFCTSNFKTVSGHPVYRLASFIDAGNGSAVDVICRVAQKYKQRNRNVFTPIKGVGQPHADLFKESKTGGRHLQMLNVNAGKNFIAKLLNVAVHDPGEEQPTRIYFSHSLPDDYFIQLTSEKRIVKNGAYVWEKKTQSNNDRNEALDTLNYALICSKWYLNKLGTKPFAELRMFNHRLRNEEQTEQKSINKTVKPNPFKRNSGGGWFNN